MIIEKKRFDEERALYALRNAEVLRCTFAGDADGESALKEARGISVRKCRFALRYPFWHNRDYLIEDSKMTGKVRAAVWYSENGCIRNCDIHGVKCLRECRKTELSGSRIVSDEFGWRCSDIKLTDCEITSKYFLFESKNAEISGLKLKGKYSFQYTKNMTVCGSELDTKDAFWHAENITVKDSVIKGEYLGWYSHGLTLINCEISGTQPLCYCKGLRLINCRMNGTDLSFEYSDVEADVVGSILSVKNPHSGHITADGYGEIILGDSVMKNDCEILVR